MSSLKTKIFKSEIKSFSLQNIPYDSKSVSLFSADNIFYHKFKKGQIIFYEGHYPYGIFILKSGEVEVSYRKEKPERVNSFAFLGISAFKNRITYLGTAKAVTECEMYFISTSSYYELLKNNNQLALWISQ